jgi:outer membrane protein assembly factor BamA
VNGYFYPEIRAEIDTTKHAAKIIYEVDAGIGYRIDTLFVCTQPDFICGKITDFLEEKPIIEPGDLLKKENLELTRSNVARSFQNEGYFYFSPQFTSFEADSNDGSATVDLYLKTHERLTPVALQKFHFETIELDLSVGSPNRQILGDSLRAIIDPERLFLRPDALEPFFSIRPGKLYSKDDEEVTLKQLSKLEVFEFINISYSPDTTGKNTLNATLTANPRKKHSARAEFNLATTSTNFAGPGLQFEYYNRNAFRGAEKFRLTATTRYEQQFAGQDVGIAAYEVDVQANLLIPKVSLPLINAARGNVPSTKYRLQYRLYSQPEYYAQSSFGAGFGYEWLSTKGVFNDLRLINFDYLRLLSSSERLEELILDNVLSRESFEDQVIAGISHSLSYSPAAKPGKRTRYFMGGSLELAGNIFNTVYNLAGAEKNENGQYTFFQVPFAQYARIQTDLRFFFNWAKYNNLALRQIVSVGIPYGNSTALPFAKQFFVGGASSLRGFQLRSVGPGSYQNPNTEENTFFDQTGDIQIEYNIENRFELGGYFEGAIFLDIGNVWLKNESETRPGGSFQWNDFVREMAASAGFGIRINLDFILVRFDLAAPIRLPYLPEGERWVIDKFSFSKDWRDENIILNFAIGYPF